MDFAAASANLAGNLMVGVTSSAAGTASGHYDLGEEDVSGTKAVECSYRCSFLAVWAALACLAACCITDQLSYLEEDDLVTLNEHFDFIYIQDELQAPFFAYLVADLASVRTSLVLILDAYLSTSSCQAYLQEHLQAVEAVIQHWDAFVHVVAFEVEVDDLVFLNHHHGMVARFN